METSQLTKWIPLATVIGAGLVLWQLSQPARLSPPEKSNTRMGGPAPLKDYAAPTVPRDPFAQPAPNAAPDDNKDVKRPRRRRSDEIRLDGIFWDPTTPMVSINGRILSEGEKIKKFQVIKIHPDHVVLEVDGKRVTRRLVQ